MNEKDIFVKDNIYKTSFNPTPASELSTHVGGGV